MTFMGRLLYLGCPILAISSLVWVLFTDEWWHVLVPIGALMLWAFVYLSMFGQDINYRSRRY